MNVQDREELWITAGEYVLGVLTTAEVEEVERLMESHEELRTAVYFWQNRLFGVSAIAEPVELAPDLWSRIEQRIAAIKPAQPTVPSRPNLWQMIRRSELWQSINFWRSTSAVGVATSVIFAVLVLQKPASNQTPEFTVVLQASSDKTASWVMQGNADANLRIIPLVKPAVDSNKALQLWTLTNPKQKPVSLGLMSSDRSVSIPANQLPDLKPGQVFAVSLEPHTGSPTGRPTGPVLYTGQAVEVR